MSSRGRPEPDPSPYGERSLDDDAAEALASLVQEPGPQGPRADQTVHVEGSVQESAPGPLDGDDGIGRPPSVVDPVHQPPLQPSAGRLPPVVETSLSVESGASPSAAPRPVPESRPTTADQGRSAPLFETVQSPAVGREAPPARHPDRLPLFDDGNAAQPQATTTVEGAEPAALRWSTVVHEPQGAPLPSPDDGGPRLFLEGSTASPARSLGPAPDPGRLEPLPATLLDLADRRWFRATMAGVAALTALAIGFVVLNLGGDDADDVANPTSLVELGDDAESLADTVPGGPALAVTSDGDGSSGSFTGAGTTTTAVSQRPATSASPPTSASTTSSSESSTTDPSSTSSTSDPSSTTSSTTDPSSTSTSEDTTTTTTEDTTTTSEDTTTTTEDTTTTSEDTTTTTEDTTTTSEDTTTTLAGG